MKAHYAVLVGLSLFTIASFGQGTVFFGNTSSTRITTNVLDSTSYTSGTGTYKFSLYLADPGNPFMLVATTTNSPGPLGLGRFDGGNIPLAYPVGTLLSFQVRGWTSAGGATYEEAVANSAVDSFIGLGNSTIGSFTVPAGGSSPVLLFGFLPGQVGGFVIGTPVPEPSTWALLFLGLGLGGRMWRSRRG